MFKKKKDKFIGQIHFIDQSEKVVLKEKITDMPYRNDVIVELSIEKFNDEDPCIIHQTYCRNMLGLGLIEEINTHHKDTLGKLIDTVNTPQVIMDKLDNVEINKIYDRYNIKYIKLV